MSNPKEVVLLMWALAEAAGIPPGPPETVVPCLIERGLIGQTASEISGRISISVTAKGEALLRSGRAQRAN